jgi:hypothetical protein
MKTLHLVLAALSFGLAGAAFAQNAAPPTDNPAYVAMVQACKTDVEKFCPGKEGLDQRQCMMAHEKSVSKACTDARDRFEASAPGLATPPKTN